MLWFVYLAFRLLHTIALLISEFLRALDGVVGFQWVGGVANVSACHFLTIFYLSFKLGMPVQVLLHESEALCYETYFFYLMHDYFFVEMERSFTIKAIV